MLRRYFKGDQLTFIKVARVVSDDDTGTLLWLAAGSPYWRLIDAAGRTLHDAAIDELVDARLEELTWEGASLLLWIPPAGAYSVWWFFKPDFIGWYINLEAPSVRWSGGFDTVDHALDIWVEPDGTWRWKDFDEFESRIGHPLYWNATEAAEIRALGEHLASLAEAGNHPFDGTHHDFQPDPPWPAPGPGLPPGWDRPRAR
ncbi:DUF402 domain-containing protein [Luedemannella flava]|uniref:DUF402 domain-containing protein n=1 Tax=Luedemannella flava TaxID=349316 RepID=A0ABP4YC15_9ACTN